MIIKDLIEYLKQFDENTKIFIEKYDDNNGLTYIQEPGINLKDEIKYKKDENDIYYSNGLKFDGILKNVLIIE